MKRLLFVWLCILPVMAQAHDEPRWKRILDAIAASGGAGHEIQYEGTGLTAEPALDFAGAGVVCSEETGKTLCTIAGGGAATELNSAGVDIRYDATENWWYLDLDGGGTKGTQEPYINEQVGWHNAPNWDSASGTCGVQEVLDAFTGSDGVRVHLPHNNICSLVTSPPIQIGTGGVPEGGTTLAGCGAGNGNTNNGCSHLEYAGSFASGSGLSITITPSGSQTATVVRGSGDWTADGDGVEAGHWLRMQDASGNPVFANEPNNSAVKVISATALTLTVEDPGDRLISEGPVASVSYASSFEMIAIAGGYHVTLQDFTMDGVGEAFAAVTIRTDTQGGDSETNLLNMISNVNIRSTGDAPTYLDFGIWVEGHDATLPTNDQAADTLLIFHSQIQDWGCAFFNTVQATNVLIEHVGCHPHDRYGFQIERANVYFDQLHTTATDVDVVAAIYLGEFSGPVSVINGNFEQQNGSAISCDAGRVRTTTLVGNRFVAKNAPAQYWIDCPQVGPWGAFSNTYEADSGDSGILSVPDAFPYVEFGESWQRGSTGYDLTVLSSRDTPDNTFTHDSIFTGAFLVESLLFEVRSAVTSVGANFTMYEALDNGTDAVIVRAPANLTGSRLFEYPSDIATPGEVLTSTGVLGETEWQAAPAGTGDVTDVGDCNSGACFDGTAGSGSLLSTEIGLDIQIDADNDDVTVFRLLNGLAAAVFTVSEDGDVTITGDLEGTQTGAGCITLTDSDALGTTEIFVLDGVVTPNEDTNATPCDGI